MSKDWTGNGNSVFKTLGASNHTDSERQSEDYYATDPVAIHKINLAWPSEYVSLQHEKRDDRMEITLTISRTKVLTEVAQKTAYTGAKMDRDETAYERISTVDEDNSELYHLWDELRPPLSYAVSGMLLSEGMDEDGDTYNLVLDVSDEFNAAMLPSMTLDLFYYFVYGILGKWYMYTNKEEAAAYALMAENALEALEAKTIASAFTRKMFPW